MSSLQKQFAFAWNASALGDTMKKRRISPRRWVQIGVTALTNGYVNGFLQGKIYDGPLKRLCVPGLNCYSCPGALGSCPIGALQAVVGSRDYSVAFSIIGFLMVVGAFFGRTVCGWLCPFGFLQEMLYKIPLLKKRKTLPGHRVMIYLKYLILVVFVFALPLIFVDILGQGSPYFCKLICPAGTLEAGIPLALRNEGIRASLGALFQWKVVLLLAVVVLSIKAFRPFCKYVCPLGAAYALFNRVAFLRFVVEEEKCVQCGKCTAVCPMAVQPNKTPNHAECIRCGKCLEVCPTKAIHRIQKKEK